MVQVSSGSPLQNSRTLDRTTPRPPTPPRESPRSKRGSNQVDSTPSGNEKVKLLSSPLPQEASPPTSSSESTSNRPKKRVVWSPWTTYHKPDSSPFSPSTARLRPSAATDPKSLKSILKHYSPSAFAGTSTSSLEQPLLIHTHASFTTMLESVVQALASPERSKKLDTYIAFCNTLRAYDDIPDWNAMERKVPILCGYLKRDLQAKMEEGGNPDSQLTQQATKLLTILCWYERLVNVIDDQCAAFFIHYAIQKIEDPQTSKASVNLHLHFLAQQKLAAPRIMTTDRCNRIITALETLDERVSGKSITKERIDVYSKLLSQSRSVMLARVSNWMRHAFGGLMNSIKEVRLRALIFLREAALVLGKEKAVSRAISNIFNLDEKKMFDSIRLRLNHFIKNEREGQYVSQLWAVVVLLVQSVGDKWEYFNAWLRVIETCFNVSDTDAKVEAQLAWSKFIYISNIGPNTQRKFLDLLCKPMEQYLNPTTNANSRKPRRAALSNVCVYLYYGFRPNSTPKQLSQIWDVIGFGLIQKLILAGNEATDGCAILSSLLDGSTLKRWSEDRIIVGPPFMKIDELPRLDPKWVRSNCAKVLQTVEIAIERTSWEDSDTVGGARLLWKRFVCTLGEAGSKEIKITPELMEAVSHLLNMFQHLWKAGPKGTDKSQSNSKISFIEKFTFLVEKSLQALGTLCFTEKQLAVDEQSKFIIASTPTHKFAADSIDDHRYAPLLHILRLFMEPPEGAIVDEQYFSCVQRILANCCVPQDSRRKKLHLLASCETLLPKRDVGTVHLGLWDILAELTRSALPSAPREKALLSPSPLGGEFKDAVLILKWGSQQHVSGWKHLFQELINIIQHELGDTYVSTNVIGPLAESLRYSNQDSNIDLTVRRTIILLQNAYPSKKKPAAEGMFKLQFGISDRKPMNHDVLESLYSLTSSLLVQLYESAPGKETVSLGFELFTAAVDFMTRASPGSISQLKQMQVGLGLWVKDTSHLVSLTNGLTGPSATRLWEKILLMIEALPQHNNETLTSLSVLLSSGFESKRKGTVNATIKTWNSTFGKQPCLCYNNRLRVALAKLKSVVEISLPGFPEDDAQIHTPPKFSESQEQEEDQFIDDIPWSSPTPARSSLFRDQKARTMSPVSMVKETPFNVHSRRSSTPRSRPTPAKTENKPKPKHMDSQLDFVAIDGTPSFETQNSQLMTEHQKAVREKQTETAVLFPDLINHTTKRPTRLSTSNTIDADHPLVTAKQMELESKALADISFNRRLFKGREDITSFVSDSVVGSPTESRIVPILVSALKPDCVHEKVKEAFPVSPDDGLQRDISLPASTNSALSAEAVPHLQSPIDEHSVDDNFVDAPDHFQMDDEDIAVILAPEPKSAAPSKVIPDIAIHLSPIQNHDEYEHQLSNVSSDHELDAQILEQARLLKGTQKSSKNLRSRKRKREVLDKINTTAISASDVEKSPGLPPLEMERPNKRARAPEAEDSPMRITRSSAKKAKSQPQLPQRGRRRKPASASGRANSDKRNDRSISRSPNQDTDFPRNLRGRHIDAQNKNSAKKEVQQTQNLSYIQETQFNPVIPDSQGSTGSKAGSTPTKGNEAEALFLEDTVMVEQPPVEGRKNSNFGTDGLVNGSLKGSVSGKRGRSNRQLSTAIAKGITGSINQHNTTKPTIVDNEVTKNEDVTGEKPDDVHNSKSAVNSLRYALGIIENSTLDTEELAAVQDELIETLAKLRKKSRSSIA